MEFTYFFIAFFIGCTVGYQLVEFIKDVLPHKNTKFCDYCKCAFWDNEEFCPYCGGLLDDYVIED